MFVFEFVVVFIVVFFSIGLCGESRGAETGPMALVLGALNAPNGYGKRNREAPSSRKARGRHPIVSA
jgi:hypothetical protein